MRNYTQTVLRKMFQQDVGRSMLDSGGIPTYDADGKYAGSSQGYGRAFERNRGRKFVGEPFGSISFSPQHDWKGRVEIDVSVNAFQWLLERVSYDAEMNAKFKKYCKKFDTGGLSAAEDFPGYLDVETRYVCNTYNGDCCLSQTLQFVTFYMKTDRWDEEYVLLQVHGGCDVRGGYTEPVAFRVNNGSLTDYGDVTIGPRYRPESHQQRKLLKNLPGVNPRWRSYDGGCNFEWNGEPEDLRRESFNYEVSGDPRDRGRGVLYIDPDGNGYCPHTGGLIEVLC